MEPCLAPLYVPHAHGGVAALRKALRAARAVEAQVDKSETTTLKGDVLSTG